MQCHYLILNHGPSKVPKFCVDQWFFWVKLLRLFQHQGMILMTFISLQNTWQKKWDVEASFNDTRTLRRKKFFDELSNDAQLESPHDQFRVHIFLAVVDTRKPGLNHFIEL